MPDIDLQPREYAERDQRTGRLRRRMSRRWCFGWMCVGLAELAWGWWTRDATNPDVQFWFVAIFAIEVGIMFQGMMRDIY